MRSFLVAAAGLAGCLLVAPASAAPLSPVNSGVEAASTVVQVQGYRYRRDCYWTGKGWGYKHRGKVRVCRPFRPRGHGWIWYSRDGRHGWYHPKHKRWHHKW